MIVYVSIGNSDDKLSQLEWSKFVARIEAIVEGFEDGGDIYVHGRWFSAPDSSYQNACWCLEVTDEVVTRLQGNLRLAAFTFRQESIAWAEVARTTFLPPPNKTWQGWTGDGAVPINVLDDGAIPDA